MTDEPEHPINGLTDGWAGLMEALDALRAAKRLPPDEQREVEELVKITKRFVYRRS